MTDRAVHAALRRSLTIEHRTLIDATFDRWFYRDLRGKQNVLELTIYVFVLFIALIPWTFRFQALVRRPEGFRRLLVMVDLHKHLPVLFVCRYAYREDWYAFVFERTLHWRQQKPCDELPVPWSSEPSLRRLFEAK